ncbi:Transglycosylase SLT domain protein [Streptomyces sp. YIM 130001]|uniref:aggregation-promoting factor C-terminal-like domain-containing protein n=1 Tax=Streptomyces sp. YIM 130001 TaxID=2259644 RepID=UPI000E647244|nr:transglycosylase SLT domain-containing protein [Streptomyces sp. YIM 130001]RII16981.1 Transglycosylase SLT domain protein [Streptomyces sp. YIM 130001]
MTVSRIRRIATPKKALTGAAVGLATAGLVTIAAPAQAAAPAAAPAAEKASAPQAATGSAKTIAKKLIPNAKQYQAFSKIVEHESGWDTTASNPSGAYGLVQALPGSKMSSAGSDWKTNPATQIKWGLDYMNDRYGSPAEALQFWESNGWY